MRFSALPETRKTKQGGQRNPKLPHGGVKADASRGKASMTSAQRQEKHQAIHTARKAAAKGRCDKHSSAGTPRPFVFVGNLKSSVTVPKLKELFAHCGEILDIVIRCSRGQAVTAAQPPRDDPLNFRELWYATIVFRELPAAWEALSLAGTILDGRKIVVCKTAGELPEVLDFARIRFGQNQEKKGMINQFRGFPKKLVAEPTELVPREDAHTIWDISFPKTLI
ncbi:hypothetical protein H0H92_003403 [Tricholoma furcatifolium]|nr:hypothetical protein H0H92_003403 [Tricholoma furcatifolium]